jgi:hypothetical protein
LADEREQGEFLRDAGERDIAGLASFQPTTAMVVAQSRAKRPSKYCS